MFHDRGDFAAVLLGQSAQRPRQVGVADEAEELPCDLALFAIGFEGVEHMPLLDGLGIELTRRGTIGCGSNWETTAPGVFVCGDMRRGQSLVVWGLREGRDCAAAVDRYLMGYTNL